MRISVIGPVNIDMFVRGSAPVDPEALNAWVDTCDVELITAGSVGYTTDALHRLGVDVDLHTNLATDVFGDHIRRDLADRGIATTNVGEDDGLTGMALYLLLFGGTKRPLGIRFPTIRPWPDPPDVDLDAVPPDAVLCGGLLHFPDMWHGGTVGLFERARGRGVTTVLDPQFPLTPTPAPWLPHVEDVIRHTDMLLIDDNEGRNLFEVDDPIEMADRAHALGCGIVAVKLGERGAVLSDGVERVHQPAIAVPADQVAESVGAGDAFDAGLVRALLDGTDLTTAGRHATATAAATLSGRGGSENITPDAVAAMLERVPDVRPASRG